MGKPEKIETRLFINGEVCKHPRTRQRANISDQFTESSDGKKFPLYSPTTREVVAEGAWARWGLQAHC